VSRLDGPGGDVARSVAISSDGTKVFVTGSSRGAGSDTNYTTVAYAPSTGAILWAKRYNGPENVGDEAYAVAASPDGSRVFVTGAVNTGLFGFNPDYATVAYDASTGATLWVRRYNGPQNHLDYAYAIAASPDGTTVFVTGQSDGAASQADYATIAYDAATGATLWIRRYDGPGDNVDGAGSVAISPNGSKVFVTGGSIGATSSYDYATIAYDASTGATMWTRRYNGPGNDSDLAHAIATSPDGSKVFVTGSSIASGHLDDYLTIAYDAASGAVVWAGRYNGPGDHIDLSFSLTASADGTKVFVTGQSLGETSFYDYATVAYDASTGAPLWTRRYNGPGNGNDGGYDVAGSSDGSKVFVTGYSSESGTSIDDCATIAYDASTGAALWTRRYNGPGNGTDLAHAIATSPDGSAVFVTGESIGATSLSDYVTIAYEP
jgi:hypothetical protein